jgi:hypothetical protein
MAHAIELHGLTKDYDKLRALEGVSLAVEARQPRCNLQGGIG